MLKKVFVFSLFIFSLLVLTSCTKVEGDGFIPSDKLQEYGFFQMPRPSGITNESFVITDSKIEYSGLMSYNDFQKYTSST